MGTGAAVRTIHPIAVMLACLLPAGAVRAAGPAAKPAEYKPGKLLWKALAGPMAGVEEVVFAVRAQGQDPHWYANFGYWCSDPQRVMYADGGAQLCRLNLLTGKLTVLLDDPQGSVRDPAVHYDGQTVLFAYRKGGTRHYNLYKMRLDADGHGPMRRVTEGPFDDIEPCWLPNGDIAFCSSRCNRWVGCWHTQVAILYRCDADGGNARPISSNIEHDNTPAVLPDGRVLYTRWEYVDRSQVDFHHLWVANPDGTGQMTYFGNMHAGGLVIDAVPVPPRRGPGRAGGSADDPGLVAAIFSPGHGRREHAGELHLLRPDAGPDARGSAEPVRGCPRWVRDPLAFREDCFLVARAGQLLLIDAAEGKSEVVHELPESLRRRKLELHEPRALRPRPREVVLADRADPAQATGRFLLADVAHGRRMEGVKAGEVRKLLVLEGLPKPVNFSGGPEPLSYLGTFTLERVLGTVPVEADGSAYFEAPANRPVFFVALDGRDLSVKRMQSFTSVMPGETAGCVGCHEDRAEAGRMNGSLAALRRPPSRIEPFRNFPDVLDFPRDIQPILDRHCVRCHDGPQRSDGVALCGDRGPRYSHAYWSLLAWGQVADGRNGLGNRPPRSIGSSASPLMAKLGGAHNKVKLSPAEWRTVWLWLESGAPYAGTYAALGTGEADVPFWTAEMDVLQRRCARCHCPPRVDLRHPPGKFPLPAARHPRRPDGPAYERWVGAYEPAGRRSIHIIVNLTRPECSPLLLAPLSKDAGGWATATVNGAKPGGPHAVVFPSTEDADYQKLLAHIRGAAGQLEQAGHFDAPGFRPNEHYLREMKRYGILPKSFNAAEDPIDVYRIDRAYWRSFWYTPGK